MGQQVNRLMNKTKTSSGENFYVIVGLMRVREPRAGADAIGVTDREFLSNIVMEFIECRLSFALIDHLDRGSNLVSQRILQLFRIGHCVASEQLIRRVLNG